MDHSYSMKKSKFMRSELEEDLNTSRPTVVPPQEPVIVNTERQDGPPDHSYSVKDKPKMPHRERQTREKIQLPYPLEKDHPYVRGEPRPKEIIVSITSNIHTICVHKLSLSDKWYYTTLTDVRWYRDSVLFN